MTGFVDDWTARREERRASELSLLASLWSQHTELKTLLDECSGHWGFEDPVYRFYHQSFKVYYLQERTLRIVAALEQLAPGCALHPWFREIVEQGTGKVFKTADNNNWTPVTRPILEAFFHATFFLKMAVQYSELQEPPEFLPSGYAALLYLYGLR